MRIFDQLEMDNLDDRQEILAMLSRLSPQHRVDFLEWCCRQSKAGHGTPPQLSAKCKAQVDAARRSSEADEKLTLDLFFDFYTLKCQYKLDIRKAANRLERVVKRIGVKPQGGRFRVRA